MCMCTGMPASWQEGSDSELCLLGIPDFQELWQLAEDAVFITSAYKQQQVHAFFMSVLQGLETSLSLDQQLKYYL